MRIRGGKGSETRVAGFVEGKMSSYCNAEGASGQSIVNHPTDSVRRSTGQDTNRGVKPPDGTSESRCVAYPRYFVLSTLPTCRLHIPGDAIKLLWRHDY